MEINFGKINNVVLTALSINDGDGLLTTLGEWFWKFSNSNQSDMSIHVPKFDIEVMPKSYEYIRLINLCYYLVQKSKIEDYRNLALFDIFEYNSKRKNTNNSLVFKKEYNGKYYFGEEEVLISEDRFVPVFKADELEVASDSQLNAIANTFKLFKVISESGLINKPILIESGDNSCLSITTADIDAKDFINNRHVHYSNKFSEEEIIAIRGRYYGDLHSQIKIEYPYHRNIDSRLNVAKNKKVGLSFYNRFFYSEIEDNDIVLLPSEIIENKVSIVEPNIEIFDTNHCVDIFEILEEFRDNWKSYDFNKYTTPFPKYWLLFIHRGKSVDDWKELFRQDYPNLINKPILSEFDWIIEYLYELNWWKNFIVSNKEATFMMPEFIGVKNKYLYEVADSLKLYLYSIDSSVTFVKSIDDFEDSSGKLFILNGFNILDIVNKNSELFNCDYSYLFPDFLFFCSNSWLKYHIISYQTSVLLSNLRKEIDENYHLNKSFCENVIEKYIKETKTNIKNYRQKYILKEEVVSNEEEINEQDDFILNNDEEVDTRYFNEEVAKSSEVIIYTETGEEFNLRSGSKILLQKDTIINSTVKNLFIGDCFIPYSDINKMVKDKGLIDKLSRISERVENFQSVLYKKDNVYNSLVAKGLSHRNREYFNKHYLISKENIGKDTFRLPKRKKDWKIICDYIGINSDDGLQTWMVYYGRKYLNKLKELYENILELFIEREFLGKYEDKEIYKEVSDLIENREVLFDGEENYSSEEIAKYVINSLVNETLLYQVKNINKVDTNE